MITRSRPPTTPGEADGTTMRKSICAPSPVPVDLPPST